MIVAGGRVGSPSVEPTFPPVPVATVAAAAGADLFGDPVTSVTEAFYDSRSFVKAYDASQLAGQHLPAHHSSGVPFSWYSQTAGITKRVSLHSICCRTR